MAETFVGIEAALGYRGEGVVENPCLAVDLAMTGVGTMEECHNALVAAGISSEDGMSELPAEGGKLTINGRVVSFGETNMWFDVVSAVTDSVAQFEGGNGTIFTVKLTDNPDDERMHLILLAGQFKEGSGGIDSDEGRYGDVLVGDSLADDMQRVSPDEVNARLERTLDWAGALFSYHVSVDTVAS